MGVTSGSGNSRVLLLISQGTLSFGGKNRSSRSPAVYLTVGHLVGWIWTGVTPRGHAFTAGALCKAEAGAQARVSPQQQLSNVGGRVPLDSQQGFRAPESFVFVGYT